MDVARLYQFASRLENELFSLQVQMWWGVNLFLTWWLVHETAEGKRRRENSPREAPQVALVFLHENFPMPDAWAAATRLSIRAAWGLL